MASLHHIGNTILGDAENIIIVPLSAVTMVYTNLTLYFATWEYNPDTDEEREICCTQFTEPSPILDPQLRVPILFEIIGQISLEECFLTVDGLLRLPYLCTTVVENAELHHALPMSRSDDRFGWCSHSNLVTAEENLSASGSS
ncbi:hypothetical protein LXA43DRAFT_1068178 [Ganoderma leucocontextum]|nr:hypothetical protein LXA43DRAFT_1068178 [Ganoderma leucocontextum]